MKSGLFEPFEHLVAGLLGTELRGEPLGGEKRRHADHGGPLSLGFLSSIQLRIGRRVPRDRVMVFSRTLRPDSFPEIDPRSEPFSLHPQNLPYRCAVIDRQMSPQTGEAMTKRDRAPGGVQPNNKPLTPSRS